MGGKAIIPFFTDNDVPDSECCRDDLSRTEARFDRCETGHDERPEHDCTQVKGRSR